MKKQYTEQDFIIKTGLKETHDKRIPFIFRSKDDEIEANFFWIPNDVQLRYMFFSGYDCYKLGYPFANPNGTGILPDKKIILRSFLRHLNQVLIELKGGKENNVPRISTAMQG